MRTSRLPLSYVNQWTKILTFAILASFLVAANGSASQLQIRILDATASEVKAKVTSALLQFSGNLIVRSGELHLDPISKEPKAVRLVLDPKSFKADSATNAQLASTLIQTLPQDPVLFRSREIRRLSGNRYQVLGTSQWGSRSYDLNFVAKMSADSTSQVARNSQGEISSSGDARLGTAIRNIQSQVSRFTVVMEGPIELFPNTASGLGALASTQETRGAIRAALIFREKQ